MSHFWNYLKSVTFSSVFNWNSYIDGVEINTDM